MKSYIKKITLLVVLFVSGITSCMHEQNDQSASKCCVPWQAAIVGVLSFAAPAAAGFGVVSTFEGNKARSALWLGTSVLAAAGACYTAVSALDSLRFDNNKYANASRALADQETPILSRALRVGLMSGTGVAVTYTAGKAIRLYLS